MSKILNYSKLDEKSERYLKDYFKDKVHWNYLKCNGVSLPESYQFFGEQILNMDVRDDDIWVCSFPKSGTTWTQEMVWRIANDVNLELELEDIALRFPSLEVSLTYGFWELKSKNPDIQLPDHISNSVDYVEKLPSPRFIKTHLPFKLLPLKLQQNKTNAKIVYVVRNPRDTCVSFYHHYKLLVRYNKDFEKFCEMFLHGCLKYEPYWENVLGFWNQRHNPNILILKFEDMKKDLRSVLIKTANFFGKNLTEDQIQKLIVLLSLQNMRENRSINQEPFIEIYKKWFPVNSEGKFIRCGGIDQWKADMSPEMIEKFKKWEKENLVGTGLTL
ncbi:hypothetical protein PGB90_006151 [Kerria lacca]